MSTISLMLLIYSSQAVLQFYVKLLKKTSWVNFLMFNVVVFFANCTKTGLNTIYKATDSVYYKLDYIF